MLQLFVNGPPGAGKTTLCKLLCAELRLEQLSTGDLLKDNIAQRTELGRVAKQCIASKSLVPDYVVVDMVAEKVLECSLRGQGWVLDGFPRTVEQCAALRRKMISPSVVIILELSERACAQRITGRRFDSVSGAIYHLPNLPPRDAAILARLTKRGDDTSDKLPPRFEAYRSYGEKTNAVFSAIAHHVDASAKTPEELLEDVLALLHAIRPTSSGGNSGSSFSSVGNNAERSLQGNQHHACGSMQSPPTSVPTAASKQPKVHSAPQRIDEEDDEDELSIGLHEISYDEDDDSGAAASVSVSSSAQQPTRAKQVELEPQSPVESGVPILKKTACSAGSSSRGSSSNNDDNNDNEELSSPSAVAASASAPPAVGSSSTTLASPSPPPAVAAPTLVNGVDMAAFKDKLLDGFEVLKHGRRGSPHMRLVFTDMDFKRIFWQKVVKGSKTKKPKLDQSLVLADVVQVVRGMKTEVLKRSGDVSKYERYLSLVADDRTLDMELSDDAACDCLLRGFDVLLHGGQ